MNSQYLAFNIGEIVIGDSGSLGTTYSSAGTLVNIIVRNSLVLAGIIFLALLVFGGVLFIKSAGSGDQKQADKAKGAITNAIIGFAIVFGAFLIIQLIEVITGLKILNSGL